jgi:hypothetical protein
MFQLALAARADASGSINMRSGASTKQTATATWHTRWSLFEILMRMMLSSSE